MLEQGPPAPQFRVSHPVPLAKAMPDSDCAAAVQVRDSARHALEGSPKEPPSLREVLTGRPDQEEASSAAPQGGLRDPRGLLKAMGMKTREVSKDSGGEQLSRRTSVRAGGGAPLGARRWVRLSET